MIKTFKQPNILILTPLHPMAVMETLFTINSSFNSHNEIFSIQSMALLGESINWSPVQDEESTYLTINHLFCSNPNCASLRQYPKKPYIIVGNLPKHANIKPDVILCMRSPLYSTDEEFDLYLKQANELLTTSGVETIDYYTAEDAEYTFTNISHLQLMLTKLGCRKNEAK